MEGVEAIKSNELSETIEGFDEVERVGLHRDIGTCSASLFFR